MKKVSYNEIERLGKRLKAQNGECIMIVKDGESDYTQCMIHCHTKDTALGMFVDFFQSNPELIPVCQMALGIAMDCQLCDYDDGEEEDDGDGEEFSMNLN